MGGRTKGESEAMRVKTYDVLIGLNMRSGSQYEIRVRMLQIDCDGTDVRCYSIISF